MLQPEDIIEDTYLIIEKIASGGTGIIYKAYHMRLQKYVKGQYG